MSSRGGLSVKCILITYGAKLDVIWFENIELASKHLGVGLRKVKSLIRNREAFYLNNKKCRLFVDDNIPIRSGAEMVNVPIYDKEKYNNNDLINHNKPKHRRSEVTRDLVGSYSSEIIKKLRKQRLPREINTYLSPSRQLELLKEFKEKCKADRRDFVEVCVDLNLNYKAVKGETIIELEKYALGKVDVQRIKKYIEE